ncbi:hypothetical protein [uncultured Litoreibacter sp.]|uniref:hypothetical protein n=1 Tax=uncultured Litoreibacter sp. TaxID=1392394 RepID=UPI0026340137|nr:hypothetical protein [uncultured Litoreibacter sp.]
MVIIHYLIYLVLVRLMKLPVVSRVIAIAVALLAAAILDGATPQGWEPIELYGGHPFYFYVIANAPVAAAVLIISIVFFGDRPMKEER